MFYNREPGRRLPARFRRSEDGFVLVFLAVAIPALLGLVGLAIDGVRLTILDSDLAGMADTAALTAANRLDRSEDAIREAREAAYAITARGSGAESATSSLTFRFAARLEDLRRDPTYSLADSAGAAAVFVEVATGERSLVASFLQFLRVQAAPIRRSAIAVSEFFACDVTPAVICHAEPNAFATTTRPGQQLLLRMDGSRNQGSIVPLDRSDAVGGRQTLINLASDAPRFCFSDRVRLRTTIAPAQFDAALNIRFDRYYTESGPVTPDLAIFPPAPNVIQGRRFESCNSPPSGGEVYPPYRLPRDTAYGGLRLLGFWHQGDGDWKIAPAYGGTGLPVGTALDEYISWNHGDKSPAVQDRLRASPTRYALYLAELGLTPTTDAQTVDTRSLGPSVATMPTGGPRGGPFAARAESPAPVCYTGPARPVEPRRRVIYLSIADCSGFPEVATAANLSRNVGKFFLTEPSERGATLVEFVGMLQPKTDDGKLRHVVQLVDAR